MEAASSAINKLLSNAGQKTSTTEEAKSPESVAPAVAPADATDVDEATVGQKDTTVEQEVAPAVEHTHVKKVHETQEQTVVDRERHQDHYHTTIQPLKDQDIEATKHDQVTADTIERQVNKDDDAAKIKAKAEADRAGLESTRDEELHEKTSKDDTIVGEHVHHHVHETIVPVIEKEVIKPSVTHKTIPVHEVVQEKSKYEGVTTKAPISVSEFAQPLDGASAVERKHDGASAISEETHVALKE